MNALMSVRSNAAGILSPSQAQRQNVTQQLEEAAAARSGRAAVAASSVAGAAPVSASASSSNIGDAAFGGELGKETFLKLLVLELQNQDPLEPVDNTDMIAQLAQFSALEAQNNLNDQFEAMSGNIDQLNFISASQLLGKTVTGIDLNGEIRTGVVESVHLDGSVVVLTVGDEFMSMAGLIGIIDSVPDTEVTEDAS